MRLMLFHALQHLHSNGQWLAASVLWAILFVAVIALCLWFVPLIPCYWPEVFTPVPMPLGR